MIDNEIIPIAKSFVIDKRISNVILYSSVIFSLMFPSPFLKMMIFIICICKLYNYYRQRREDINRLSQLIFQV